MDDGIAFVVYGVGLPRSYNILSCIARNALQFLSASHSRLTSHSKLITFPSPGRLHEKCVELLAGADIKFNRQHRLDVALVQNHPIALYVFLTHQSLFVG